VPARQTKIQTTSNEVCWKKPETGWVKCNVDASFLNEEKKGSWGAVLQDHLGAIICSAWGAIIHCQTVAMGEAIACLHDLDLALNNSNQNIISETDCAAILEAFREGSMDRSEVCMIAKEFYLKIPPDRKVVLTKISRNCNTVAHELCRLACRDVCGGVLQSSVLTYVLRSTLTDCNPNEID
jgi:hypothetical protein